MNEADRQFQRILRGYPRPMVQMAKSVRQLIFAAAPALREELQPGYIRYRHKDRTVCDVTVHTEEVSLQFYYRHDLSDPHHLRVGTGKRLRHLTLCQPHDLRPAAVKRLLKEALADDS